MKDGKGGYWRFKSLKGSFKKETMKEEIKQRRERQTIGSCNKSRGIYIYIYMFDMLTTLVGVFKLWYFTLSLDYKHTDILPPSWSK